MTPSQTFPDSVIACHDLHKRFGKLDVLRGISVRIQQGDVVSVIGPSGCGKSTFLRCLNRLESFQQGSLVVNGQDFSAPQLNGKERRQLRQQVGMVFQHFNLFPHLTVLENLTLAPQRILRRSQSSCRELAHHYLDKVGLADRGHSYPDQLSGGQKQRVAIARTLCMQPQVVLFDEPTSALDPERVEEVLTTMRQLADGSMTLVIVTHEMKFARSVSNRVLFFNGGQIEEEGSPQAIFDHPRSERLRAFISSIHR